MYIPLLGSMATSNGFSIFMELKEIIAKIAAAYHCEFLFVQVPIFVNITQIPNLQDTNI